MILMNGERMVQMSVFLSWNVARERKNSGSKDLDMNERRPFPQLPQFQGRDKAIAASEWTFSVAAPRHWNPYAYLW